MEKESKVLGILAAGVLFAPTVALAQATYEYQLFGYPGTPDTQVFGINEEGFAVGNGFDFVGVFPFIYDIKNNTFTDVANVAGYDYTSVIGISESGRLAGNVVLGNTEFGLTRNLRGQDTVFSHPDAVNTEARGINNQGLVSGIRDSAEDPDIPTFAFIYDPKKDSFTDFAESLTTIAHGISSQGDVVGSAFFFTGFGPEDPCPGLPGDPDFRRYGWLRTADGSLTYFIVNGEFTRARGINEQRQITGFIDDFSGGGAVQKGFVVDLDGAACQALTVAAEDLLEVPGSFRTNPEGITNSGNIIGIAVVEDVNGNLVSQGFVAMPR
jgi:hypothetical protein